MRKLIIKWLKLEEYTPLQSHTEDLETVADTLEIMTKRIDYLSGQFEQLNSKIELLTAGTVEWRLAQARSSLDILTKFLNEIHYNLEKLPRTK